MPDLRSLEQRALFVALLFVVAGSVVANVFAWDAKWQIPLIYAALYAILAVALEIRENQTPPTSTYYRTSDEFFDSLRRHVQGAERRVYSSYVRRTPPPSFQSPAVRRYYETILDWTRRNPGSSYHRVMGVPAAEPHKTAMEDWLSSHHQETRGIHNYHVRVVVTDIGVDAVNLAVVDDKAVFLLLTADGSFMSGHSLETAEAVTSFRDYYSAWWASAEPLETYLQRARPSR